MPFKGLLSTCYTATFQLQNISRRCEQYCHSISKSLIKPSPFLNVTLISLWLRSESDSRLQNESIPHYYSCLRVINSLYNNFWLFSFLCPDLRTWILINTTSTSKQESIQTTKWLESQIRVGWYPIHDSECHDHNLSLCVPKMKSWYQHAEALGLRCQVLFVVVNFLPYGSPQQADEEHVFVHHRDAIFSAVRL